MVFQMMTNLLTDSESSGRGNSWEEIAPHLKQMDTRVVYAYRENILDHAVCKVRDCFTDHYGIPVNGRGQRSDLCFNRRAGDKAAKEYKAFLNPGKLVKMIEKTESDIPEEQ